MTIPRVLHQVWVGGRLPEHLAPCVRSWRRLHPTWEYRMWTDQDLGWLANRDLFDRAAELVPDDAVGQFRSDLARYEILHRHGGLYVDCDTRALRTVDRVLDGRDAFAVAEDRRWVANTYLACVPGHPVMAELVAGLPARIAALAGRRANVLSGPQYLTPIWRAHGCHVDPPDRWFPYSYRDVRAGRVRTQFGPDVHAVHLWQHTRDLLAAR